MQMDIDMCTSFGALLKMLASGHHKSQSLLDTSKSNKFEKKNVIYINKKGEYYRNTHAKD